jgi:formate-dependent nitrite reductase membrane component NrfD
MIQRQPFEYMVKYTQQKNWIDGRGNFIALAFFLGGISGGLCMGISYMIHLGQPLQSWRMFMRPKTSWISRGFIFIMLFIGLTALTLIFEQWVPNATAAITTLKVLAGIFAFAQSIYTGFAVSYVSAIKLWNSAILPILFVICGFSGGLAILMGISLGGDQISTIENVTRVTLVAFAVILIVYLWNTTYSNITARDAVARLLGGGIGAVFWVGVVVFGVVIPVAISILTYFTGETSSGLLLTAVVTEILGGLSLRYVILKGGIYTPLTSGE